MILDKIYSGTGGGCFVDCNCGDGLATPTLQLQKEQKWYGICLETNVEQYQKLRQNREDAFCKTVNHSDVALALRESRLDSVIHYLQWNYTDATTAPIHALIEQEITSRFQFIQRVWTRKIVIAKLELHSPLLAEEIATLLSDGFDLIPVDREGNVIWFLNRLYTILL